MRARTESRSLETIGSNVTGSRQSARGHVTPRPKTGEKQKFSRGLDNSGNIEGKISHFSRKPTYQRLPVSRPCAPWKFLSAAEYVFLRPLGARLTALAPPLVEAGQASTMAVLGAIVPPRKDAFQALAAQPLTQAEMACRTRP